MGMLRRIIQSRQYLETQNGNVSTDYSKYTVFGNAERKIFDRSFKIDKKLDWQMV